MESTHIQTTIETLYANREKWANLPVKYKIEYLDEIILRLKTKIPHFKKAAFLKRWGAACLDAANSSSEGLNSSAEDAGKVGGMEGKKPAFPPSSSHFAQLQFALLSVAMLSKWLNGIRHVYKVISRTGYLPECETSKLDDGTLIAKIPTFGWIEWFSRMTGDFELHLADDAVQKSPLTNHEGLCAILGAGNYDAPIDILTGMFLKNSVCIYKFSPLAGPLIPILSDLLAPLIEDGYLGIVTGGVEVGKQLTESNMVNTLIFTGAEENANKIIWGNATPPKNLPEQALRPAILSKTLIMECGNCTPWIICPGAWRKWEMSIHAKHIAFAMLFNGGHLCGHPQLLITSKDWPQREAFLRLIKENLKRATSIGSFYPFFKDKIMLAKKRLISEGCFPSEFEIPMCVQNSLVPHDKFKGVYLACNLDEDTALTHQEAFCTVCGEIPIDSAGDPELFLKKAVSFVNKKCHGNLCCSITSKASTLKEKQALTEAIVNLKYHAVCVNIYPMHTLSEPSCTWGGAKGNPLNDMQSGVGLLGNSLGWTGIKKSVSRYPFIHPLLMLFCVSGDFLGSRIEKAFDETCYALCEISTLGFSWSVLYRLSRILVALLFNI